MNKVYIFDEKKPDCYTDNDNLMSFYNQLTNNIYLGPKCNVDDVEVISKILSHEYLHHVINKLEGIEASMKLDWYINWRNKMKKYNVNYSIGYGNGGI